MFLYKTHFQKRIENILDKENNVALCQKNNKYKVRTQELQYCLLHTD